MIEINKKHHTVGTVPRYDRNKQNICGVFCLFLSYIGTVPTYDRDKQNIPHCCNNSNI
jgi:hypothetical protein